MKSSVILRLSAALSAAVCFALLLSSCLPDVVTGATAKPTPPANPADDTLKCPAREWLKAVSGGDPKTALKDAREIVEPLSVSKPSRAYAALFAKEGVPSTFLTAPLNEFDFKLWYYAWMLKDILAKSGVDDLKSDDAKLRKIMTMVSARIARKRKPKGPLAWPAQVWIRKYGQCDRMAWLFAEFAYQIGLETRIVYLMDAKGVSPHTICEIRSEDGKVWTADPYTGVLLTDVSVAKLAASPPLMRKIWPKRPDWWKALPNSVCWIPAMPQDYRKVNQRLQEDLAPALDALCPRFGEDPLVRLKRYRKLVGKDDPFETKLWFFPIRLMRVELELKSN